MENELTRAKNTKNAVFGNYILAKNSMYQIWSKYAKIVDFVGFAVLPEARKRARNL